MNQTTIYGYVRVSTIKQNNIRHQIELAQFGVIEENMSYDNVSGKDFNRKGYQKLIKKLKTNDILIIKSLDRLGRNSTRVEFYN